jgi:hypothetical protein
MKKYQLAVLEIFFLLFLSSTVTQAGIIQQGLSLLSYFTDIPTIEIPSELEASI